jgi:hypothetical protein
MVYLDIPAQPPISVENLWTACQHTWTGWDGTEWDLSHGSSGLALQSGVRGIRNPPIIRYSGKAAAVDGSLWRGSVTDERDVFWPLKVFTDGGSQAWIDHNQRFWKTLDESRQGTWSITQPSGVRRSLKVRYTGLDDDSDDIDPGLFGWCVYGIQMVAEQPFWQGDTIRRTFAPPPITNTFFGGSGGGGVGPPFYIGVGSSTDSASISNTGDVAVWPVWRVTGPTTSVTVGLAGHSIVFPMTIPDGQWIEINTAPTSQVALDQDGTDRTIQLGAVDFAEIPQGANVPLSISMTGTGSVSCTVVPLFKRGV